MKRFFGSAVFTACSLCAAFLLSSCGTSPEPLNVPETWSGSTLVATRYGVLAGVTDRNDTLSWKGIPYAEPPVGELRWRAPRPPKSWTGVKKTGSFEDSSLQRVPVVGWISGKEDSLFLNVWRPADDRTKLPVYVWIHGGGNSTGSSGSSDYRGDAFAAKAGAVFVSVNYRLGPMGWFAHPALKTGNPEDDSGNYGTLDLIAALGWIRDNIAAFGGNPGNVTIAGESAGAFNVLTLMLAPAARGLFHRAVVESGYRTDSTPEKMRNFAESLAKDLKLPGENIARELRNADAKSILSRLAGSTSGMVSIPYPNWDGTVLPAEGFEAFRNPAKVVDVPLIIGTNKEETKIFQWLGRKNSKDPSYQTESLKASLNWKAEGADSIADAILSGDPERKVYVYRFDWGAPDSSGKSVLGGSAGAKLGAAHGMEIPFFLQTDSVYGNLLPLPIFTARNARGRKDLQDSIGRYLTAFMVSGDPNKTPGTENAIGKELPRWETWSASSPMPAFLILDAGFESAEIRASTGRVTQEVKTQAP